MFKNRNAVFIFVPLLVGGGILILAVRSCEASDCTEQPNAHAYEIAKSIEIYELINHHPATSIEQLVPRVLEQHPRDPSEPANNFETVAASI
jgi:hypothetical protein